MIIAVGPKLFKAALERRVTFHNFFQLPTRRLVVGDENSVVENIGKRVNAKFGKVNLPQKKQTINENAQKCFA